MFDLYDDRLSKTRNLLLRADCQKVTLCADDSGFQFLHTLIEMKSKNAVFSPSFAIAAPDDKANQLTIIKNPWRASRLDKALMAYLLWASKDDAVSETPFCDAITQLPFIKQHLNSISKLDLNCLFDVIEMLSINIHEEYSTTAKNPLDCIYDGYTFQCSHIVAFTAACFKALGVDSRVVFGYSKNPAYQFNHVSFRYFDGSDDPSYGGLLHVWLEIQFNGALLILDPTPYFCAFQPHARKKIHVDDENYRNFHKQMVLQQRFHTTPLFERVAYERRLALGD